MKFFLKVVGVACFNATIGALFVFFYRTDLAFSVIIPQIWTLAYAINSRKENNYDN